MQNKQAHAQLRINGRAYPLQEDQCIIGRMANTSSQRPQVDLQHLSQSQTVSRRHLLIEWDGTAHYLSCLKNDPNKVYLNNQELILNKRYTLMHGDIVVFGDVLARFECLIPPFRLPELERPYVRLRWLGMGSTFYVQKNPGFIGRGRKKFFPNEYLAFNFEQETREVLSLSRPHAKLWMDHHGRVYIQNLKPNAFIWLDGQQVTKAMELNPESSLQLAQLEFQLHLLA